METNLIDFNKLLTVDTSPYREDSQILMHRILEENKCLLWLITKTIDLMSTK